MFKVLRFPMLAFVALVASSQMLSSQEDPGEGGGCPREKCVSGACGYVGHFWFCKDGSTCQEDVCRV